LDGALGNVGRPGQGGTRERVPGGAKTIRGGLQLVGGTGPVPGKLFEELRPVCVIAVNGAHNWANPQATLRSYELIAREVMPHFQGHAQATLEAARRARASRAELAATHAQAVAAAGERYRAELQTSS
jgi:hypothetical protein